MSFTADINASQAVIKSMGSFLGDTVDVTFRFMNGVNPADLTGVTALLEICTEADKVVASFTNGDGITIVSNDVKVLKAVDIKKAIADESLSWKFTMTDAAGKITTYFTGPYYLFIKQNAK